MTPFIPDRTDEARRDEDPCNLQFESFRITHSM